MRLRDHPHWIEAFWFVSNRALVFDPKDWIMVQGSRRFWKRSDARISLTTCGVSLCLARRQRVARPNCALVFTAGFLRITLSGMEKLTDERVVEPRLPFLYESRSSRQR